MNLKDRMIADVKTVFLNTDHFGETVVLHDADDTSLTAIVDIPDVIDTAEGTIDVTGSILVATSDLVNLRLDIAVVLEATIRKTVWHLYDQSTDEFGMTRFTIRRKHDETNHKYSNLYDINGTQAKWHVP